MLEAVRALCPERELIERSLNSSFADQVPRALRKRRQRLAIDLTLRPYHGQAHQREEEVYRGEAKSGTMHFHAYASCYVMHSGKRFTLGLITIEQGTTMVSVLKRLLSIATEAGIRPQ